MSKDITNKGIIKNLFSILIKGTIKNNKNYDRLLKAGKVFDNYLKLQIKTNGKKKKFTIPFLMDEIIFEIALFIPYKELKYFRKANNRFSAITKTNYFWKRKFETEYAGYEYPILYFKKRYTPPSPKIKNWRNATIVLHNFILKTRRLKDLGPKVYERGNELLLIKFINEDRYRLTDREIFEKIFIFYIEKHKKLNTQFLIDLLYYDFSVFSGIINLIQNKDFDKTLFIKEFMDIGFLEHIQLMVAYGREERDWFLIGKYINDTFYHNYKKKVTDKLKVFDNDILLKLLKFGIVLPYEAYNIYDEDFMDKAKVIDNEISYVLNPNRNFKRDFNFLLNFQPTTSNSTGYKFISEKSKNSYIFTIKALRFNKYIYKEILPKFKKKLEKDEFYYKFYRSVSISRFKILEFDKMYYIYLIGGQPLK